METDDYLHTLVYFPGAAVHYGFLSPVLTVRDAADAAKALTDMGWTVLESGPGTAANGADVWDVIVARESAWLNQKGGVDDAD